MPESTDDDDLSRQAKRLKARFFEAIWSGTEWLSADQIVQRAAGTGSAVSAVLLSKWEQERRLFGLEKAGVKVYPAYAFDSHFTPLPALAAVLGILGEGSPLGPAAFFESTSGFLEGRRPREVLAQEPQRVIAKARDERDSQDYCG